MSINPYELFGIDYNQCDLKQLKKKYYELALLCHPDKGGDEQSMITVQQSYEYILNQFENCKMKKTFEELEQEFTEFIESQKIKIPLFRHIFEESDDFQKLRDFNKLFEEQKNSFNEPQPENSNINNQIFTSFDEGYGNMMINSEYNEKNLEYTDKITVDEIDDKPHKFPNIISYNELIVYKEPEAKPIGYGSQFRYDIESTNDFSTDTSSDYQKAFSILGKDNIDSFKIKNRTLEDIIEQRNQLS